MGSTSDQPYRIVEGPTAVRQDGGDEDVPLRYQAHFSTPEGSTTLRFLTDKGRAQLLRALDDGRESFSTDEFEEMTLPPDLTLLRARFTKEGGEGG